jgi:hypothetical protein
MKGVLGIGGMIMAFDDDGVTFEGDIAFVGW